MKATKKMIDLAQEVMQAQQVNRVWVNAKGHYFTQEDWALHSVGGDKDRIALIKAKEEVQEPQAPAPSKEEIKEETPDSK
ncbi:hypothetical protein V6R21_19030 [Limibacter armeniacum]|uniref:hypothetical protein n=1 Tax=Limibacter armeniacum TaxID=466084 RepID=UPI002FE4FC06